MRDYPWLSVVVTCMGRLDQLRRSLPPLIANGTGVEIILVDWSCPDGAARHAREHWPTVRVVEIEGQVEFRKSAALNAGVRAATAPWLAILDADMIASGDLLRELADRMDPDVLLGLPDDRMAGFLACTRAAFDRAGGYDERMRGWGFEDDDLRRRLLEQGLRFERVSSSAIDIMPHDDGLRSRFHVEKDRRQSTLFNQALVWQARWTEPAMRREQWVAHPLLMPSSASIGPVFRAVQFALHLQWRVGVEDVRLLAATSPDGAASESESIERLMLDALRLIDCPGAVDVVRGPTHESVIELPFSWWRFPYFSARRMWNGWTEGRAMGRIAVGQLGDDEIEELARTVPSFTFFSIEAGTSICDAASILAHADAFVDRGGGYIHVASAVGVPAFLLVDDEDSLATVVRDDFDLEISIARTLGDVSRQLTALLGSAG